MPKLFGERNTIHHVKAYRRKDRFQYILYTIDVCFNVVLQVFSTVRVFSTFLHLFYFLYYLYLQLVAGSAVMAFEEVCPDRIDLVHKNFRKLCNLLIDIDEWGQVAVIHMLTRYARTQFLDPNKEVGFQLMI